MKTLMSFGTVYSLLSIVALYFMLTGEDLNVSVVVGFWSLLIMSAIYQTSVSIIKEIKEIKETKKEIKKIKGEIK